MQTLKKIESVLKLHVVVAACIRHSFHVLCIIFVFTTVQLKFQYDYYIGSHLGEYIPDILCVEPALTDPDEYYVQGWEGFFNTIGATTITKDITFISQKPYNFDDYEVTLNATHLKSCLDIRYPNNTGNLFYKNSFLLHDGSLTLYAYLDVFDRCKSITQVWHA